MSDILNKKRCIFHVPFYVDKNSPSGTNIRPTKIVEGLEKCGYSVDVVWGFGKERKETINKIKLNINNGIKYDFMYSESSTEPTLLTEKNHIPRYPFMDFGFMKFCKNKGIKIGLFYRDIYWRFPIYNNVPFTKRSIAKLFYRYDLLNYKRNLDILYLPHKKMEEYIPIKLKTRIEELPPAVNEIEVNNNTLESYQLKMFYVGGVSGLYDMTELFKVFNEFKQGYLTVCCRENEWKNVKGKYADLMSDNIEIIHKKGEEYAPYINSSHICSLLFQPSEYRKFAMPLKLFEYMSYGKPMISSKGTATGDFIEKKKIGWQIDYNKDDILSVLKELSHNFTDIEVKQKEILTILDENTWVSRAEKIIRDLTQG